MRNFVWGVLAFAMLVAVLAPAKEDAPGSGAIEGDSATGAPLSPAPQATPSMAAMVSAGETVLRRQPDGHFYADVQVNGRTVRFMVDTGASGIALTRDDARRAGIDFDPSRFEVVGSGASGPVKGQRVRIADMRLDLKQVANVDAAVLDDGLSVSLLGQSFLSRFGTVQIESDRMTLR